ncbi:MAG: helix-turn-helix transcriptional regulator [Bradyrhizobium sp.]|nr:helix-turn-helix transcriptional regulator [Bradyrhizobium sp.]
MTQCGISVLSTVWLMFEAVQAHLVGNCTLVAERSEGVAFFLAARHLYGLTSLNYICINISVAERSRYFVHCIYSDTRVRQFTSKEPVRFEFQTESGLGDDAERASTQITLPLNRRRGETAFFGITSAIEAASWSGHAETTLRECRILANYFHGHVLRMHGHDAEHDILVSARELDCLKWTAAGKTALEASIILGISERTVRFHLNAAREKLGCVTTTQAVAKAIMHQLIDI